MISRGEGEPAKPQEEREFNKQEANSKARSGTTEHGPEAHRIHEKGEPDGAAAEEDTARPGSSRSRGYPGREGDQRPVTRLEAPEVRARAHRDRSGEGW